MKSYTKKDKHYHTKLLSFYSFCLSVSPVFSYQIDIRPPKGIILSVFISSFCVLCVSLSRCLLLVLDTKRPTLHSHNNQRTALSSNITPVLHIILFFLLNSSNVFYLIVNCAKNEIHLYKSIQIRWALKSN